MSPWTLLYTALYREVKDHIAGDSGTAVEGWHASPDTDPSQDQGNAIQWAVSDAQYDAKSNRGRCSLAIQALSVENKTRAQDALDFLRGIFTARTLTDGNLIVAKFTQQTEGIDGGTDESDRRFAAQDVYDVRVVMVAGHV